MISAPGGGAPLRLRRARPPRRRGRARLRAPLHVGPAGPADRGRPPPAEHGTPACASTPSASWRGVDDTPLELGQRRPDRLAAGRDRRHHADRPRPALGAAGERRRGPLDPDWQHDPGGPDLDPWGAAATPGRGASATAASSPSTGWSGCAIAPTTRPPGRSCSPTRCRRCAAPRTPRTRTTTPATIPSTRSTRSACARSPTPISPASARRAAPRGPSRRWCRRVCAAGDARVDPYRGLSPVNGAFTAGDVAGGLYGAKLEVDAPLHGSPASTSGAAAGNLARLRGAGARLNPSQFYDDLDHAAALGRNGDDLVANAEGVAGKQGTCRRSAARWRWPASATTSPPARTGPGGGGRSRRLPRLDRRRRGDRHVHAHSRGRHGGRALVGAVVGMFTSGAIDSLFENGPDVGTAVDRGGEAVATPEGHRRGRRKVAKGIAGLFG